MKREAERVIESVFEALPAALQAQAQTVVVTLESWPGQELVDDGVEPDILGLFVGGEFAGGDEDPLPPEIILYLSNLWEYAGGELAVYREEVRRTLLHELGHYLGLNEDDLEQRQLD